MPHLFFFPMDRMPRVQVRLIRRYMAYTLPKHGVCTLQKRSSSDCLKNLQGKRVQQGADARVCHGMCKSRTNNTAHGLLF